MNNSHLLPVGITYGMQFNFCRIERTDIQNQKKRETFAWRNNYGNFSYFYLSLATWQNNKL